MITLTSGQVKQKDFPLTQELVSIGTYSIGGYYCYPKNHEGSENPDHWWDDWTDRLYSILQSCIGRWEKFIRYYGLPCNMSINFLEKAAVDAIPYEYDEWYKVHQACSKDERFNEPALVVAAHAWSLYIITCSFNRYIQGRADPLEENELRFSGEHVSEWVCDSVAHEWGHSFGPKDHCNAPSFTCLMSNNTRQITLTDWLARGEILWFCDDCRNQILDGWARGLYL